MSHIIDTAILELLASKICHDLISPIGAINNGLEILEDAGPNDSKEVIDLITFSAAQASAKLQAFRLAYGAGGSDYTIKPETVHKAIEGIVGTEKKIIQTWDPHINLGFEEYPKGFFKLLTALLLLAMEALPKGGRISVLKGADGKTIVRAEGEDVGLRGESKSALKLKLDPKTLEPKYVHSFMTGLLASHYGMDVEAEAGAAGALELSLRVK